jgi:hypothetical protein
LITLKEEFDKIRFFTYRKVLMSIYGINDIKKTFILYNTFNNKYELYKSEYDTMYKNCATMVNTCDLFQLIFYAKKSIHDEPLNCETYGNFIFNIMTDNYKIQSVEIFVSTYAYFLDRPHIKFESSLKKIEV